MYTELNKRTKNMVLAFSNQKGGVGKTTSVLNVGVFLAHKGKKVLLVDIDPQANLSSGVGLRKGEDKDVKYKSVYDVLINKVPTEKVIQKTKNENLDILPSSIELAGAEIEMVNMLSRENVLKKAIDSVKSQYDYVLIDCPPSLGLLTLNGQVAANKVIIPVQAEYFALEGLGQLLNTVKLVRSNLNADLEIGGVALTMFDSRTNLSRDIAMELKNYFGDKLFDTLIPRNVKLSEAPSHGLSILEYEPDSTGSKAYERLVDEMLERFDNEKS
jgi:chromosome partitioning protein